MNEYIKQAEDFLTATNTIMSVEFLKNDYHFNGDEHKRDIYNVTFKRGDRSFTVVFGQSVMDSARLVHTTTGNEFSIGGGCIKGKLKILNVEKYKKSVGKELIEVAGVPPTAYNVLTCLQKYEVGTFEDFCSEFGYDTDSRSAKKTYKAVCKEFEDVQKIWTDEEIEMLQDIS